MAGGQRLTREIPGYLLPYVVKQDPSLYTPIDHAVWRFILLVSREFFSKHAHPKYLAGLEETGISSERIPLIEEMDTRLSRFGWRAVAVSGFIPPAVFMEFLSLGILPIACDMRSLEHLAYTPAPDIVHEAAGHAPMIADPEYEAYLRDYGEVSRKAITSNQDMEVYYAIRKLSEVKEDPKSGPDEIEAAQRQLNEALAKVTYVSEAAALARMNWWTIEYGLVGRADSPAIYGAGLLSSVSESYACLGPQVKKVPFSVECVAVAYDITRPQPQLFVTPDFPSLSVGLEQLAQRMAFRRGGLEGLEKASQAGTVTTAELDSGVQISGVLANIVLGPSQQPIYLQYKGPCQLSHQNSELPKHGPETHAQGFGTPLGRVRTASGLKDAGALNADELNTGRLEFESGVLVVGKCKAALPGPRGNLVLSFESCSVKHGEKILFDASWGDFDLACGSKVTSVSGGAADRARYMRAIGGFGVPPGKPKTNWTPANSSLNQLYARIRALREELASEKLAEKLPKKLPKKLEGALSEIHAELERDHPNDWLSRFELLELAENLPARPDWRSGLERKLLEIVASQPAQAPLVRRGLEALMARARG